MIKTKIAPGIFYLEIPEKDIRILCGSPMDSIKHLMQRGIVRPYEENGYYFESGPNMVLLSDVPMQKGNFWNLAEFPVLHMMYKQGMVIPGHPKNTGIKPILIGKKDQVDAQSRYITRGTYGLISKEELIDSGYTPAEADELMDLKLCFHYGSIKGTEDLLDSLYVENEKMEIRNSVYIQRVGLNIFEISDSGESMIVNLNLMAQEQYVSPYRLDFHELNREYFSIVHIGEGNGWEKDKPCMGSILIFQGKIYLIDAGPDIHYSLTALGLCVNEIEGIFHTHAHDDHFAGLTTLIQADHRIRYFSTPPVRESVKKKMSALMNTEEDLFENYFEVIDLEYDSWNNIEGLEVYPCHSPHPLETAIYYFRTLWKNGYKSYAHLADTVTLENLAKFREDNRPEKPNISHDFYNKVVADYKRPADIKKIDIGGGAVHGSASDFIDDKSGKIILSHFNGDLKPEEREIGSNAVFGIQEIIIPARKNYLLDSAKKYLDSYFPHISPSDYNMFLNCDIENVKPGTILIRKGDIPEHVCFLLTGVAEYISTKENQVNKIAVGSLIGDSFCLNDNPAPGTFRTKCYCYVLKIPRELYRNFIERNNLESMITTVSNNRIFLSRTSLLGNMLSYPLQVMISKNMKLHSFEVGDEVGPDENEYIYFLNKGVVSIYNGEKKVDTLESGDYFAVESALNIMQDGRLPKKLVSRFETDGTAYSVPQEIFRFIPIVQLSLLEYYQRLLKRDN